MNKILATACTVLALAGATSCNDYIDILPKGSVIPTTLQDYEALLRYEYSSNFISSRQDQYLLNDLFMAKNSRSSYNLNATHYMWAEDRDRTELNASTEDVFDKGYGIIGIANTLIEGVPAATECTEAEKNEVLSYAYAIRAFILHYIVNYYSDAYTPEKAANTPGVPLIYSAGLGSPYHQGTVKEVYDQIVADFNKALELGVPEKSMTIIHPSRAAVEAGLARVLLCMQNYSEALKHADEALKRNSNLMDWTDYYNQNKGTIEKENDYTNIASPMAHTAIENIWFCSGNCSPNYFQADMSISEERRALFEDGDMRASTRWKKYISSADTYYIGLLKGYFNFAGIATPEVFLIKAECEARTGNLNKAMDALNTVRKTRINPEVYADKAATTEAQAMEYIMRTKHDELMNTMIPFIDFKRLNAEGKYARTFTKVEDGKTLTLSPTSHLWTMVFPANAINRPGNGTLTQNSK